MANVWASIPLDCTVLTLGALGAWLHHRLTTTNEPSRKEESTGQRPVAESD